MSYKYASHTLNEPLTFTVIVSRVSYRIIDLIFNKSASFSVDFFDQNDRHYKTSLYNMSEEEYKNWNNDDNYVFEMIMKNINDII
jgi:hypothetical protein